MFHAVAAFCRTPMLFLFSKTIFLLIKGLKCSQMTRFLWKKRRSLNGIAISVARLTEVDSFFSFFPHLDVIFVQFISLYLSQASAVYVLYIVQRLQHHNFHRVAFVCLRNALDFD